MREEIANLTSSALVSDQELVSTRPKQSRNRFGYYSMIAAVPAMVVSNIPEKLPLPDGPTKIEPSVAEQNRRLPRKQRPIASPPALLKRQSAFRLPHQRDSFSILAALSGNDDCPGRIIPGGTYTAAAPYTDAGDTTSANNTINSFYGYYYVYEASGPDHIYTFTATGLGSNPQIKVSATSSTYRPLIYIVIDGESSGSCPAGTGNFSSNVLWWFTSWSDDKGVATLNSQTMQYLPLNVPLHLFVDGVHNDAQGSGPYTVQMQDVTIASSSEACATANPIDCPDFFIRQQYRDFLGREPDPNGFENWMATLQGCANGGYGEFDNPYCDRVHVSAGFVQSEEFQGRGYWILRYGYVGLNRSIGAVRSSATYAEFTPALAQVGGSNSPAQEEAAKVAYANAFVQRSDFLTLFPMTMTASQYVNALESNAQVTLPNKQTLIDALQGGTMSRADVLRNVVESQVVFDKYVVPGFVTMEYFGYLRRDPDLIGYQNWVNTLTADPNNYRHMIFGFIYSTEYRQRFGLP